MPAPPDDPSPLLARRPYALFLAGRFCGTLATGSHAVVIAWEVYELARQTMSVAEASFAVGMSGLVSDFLSKAFNAWLFPWKPA